MSCSGKSKNHIILGISRDMRFRFGMIYNVRLFSEKANNIVDSSFRNLELLL